MRGGTCPQKCPSRSRLSSVQHSNYLDDLCGATGIRTPDLLHAISTHDVRLRTSVQVIVPGRAPASVQIRVSCGTFALYRPGRQINGVHPTSPVLVRHLTGAAQAGQCQVGHLSTRNVSAGPGKAAIR